MTELTTRQADLLANIYPNHEARLLADRINRGDMTRREIEEVCYKINDEFLAKGLLPTCEPNSYGLELEDLLDCVNRPNLR